MTWFRVLFGEKRSLHRSLVVHVLIAITCCIALAATILTSEFWEYLEENLNDELTREAREIAAQLTPDAPDLGLNPDTIRFRGDEGAFRYTVYDELGVPIVGGEHPANLAPRLSGGVLKRPEIFDLGAAIVTEVWGQRYILLASTQVVDPNKAEYLDDLLHEVTEELHWVGVGILVILLAAVLAARRTLRAIGPVSRQARQIGPGTGTVQLSTENLPSEILPLVRAVNEAFARLEGGYQAQRDFSSNVAHEVRTPLAVLRSTIDRIDDADLRKTLNRDIAPLEQIFEQLIDPSRAEALGVSTFEPVNLHEIAVQLACGLGVGAMKQGKQLAVIGDMDVVVRGHAGLLRIALGNLVRNAINYTTEAGEIEIEVTAGPDGWRVLDRGPGVPDAQKALLFQQFQRGASAEKAGSGIGLAIVKSVADAHRATVSVTDRDGGGSIFTFAFEGDLAACKEEVS